jgi:hypothetical protein
MRCFLADLALFPKNANVQCMNEILAFAACPNSSGARCLFFGCRNGRPRLFTRSLSCLFPLLVSGRQTRARDLLRATTHVKVVSTCSVYFTSEGSHAQKPRVSSCLRADFSRVLLAPSMKNPLASTLRLSTSLRLSTGASAETGLQAVDEVADDG